MDYQWVQQVLHDSFEEAKRAMRAISEIVNSPEVQSKGLTPDQFGELTSNQQAWHEAMSRHIEAAAHIQSASGSVVEPS